MTRRADQRKAAAPFTRLHPAARMLWRTGDQAQLEIGCRRVVVDGLGHDAARRLLGQSPGSAPVDPSVSALQNRLLDVGFLWPGAEPGADDPLRSPPAPRLAAELTALSARVGDRAAELLHARRHCTVVVSGPGRAGPLVAALLAAAGVGRVSVSDTSPTRLHHAVPGGVSPADEGTPLARAAETAIVRCAPDTDVMPAPYGSAPDLVVLAVDEPVAPERSQALHHAGTAHLPIVLANSRAVVGPLVLPGLTSCLRCADLHRLDRDPAWSALAVQLTVPHRAAAASEVAVAAMVAGLAAMQALEFLDGGRPDVIEGTLEVQPPDWRVRRRTWPVHPDCDCMIDNVRDEGVAHAAVTTVGHND